MIRNTLVYLIILVNSTLGFTQITWDGGAGTTNWGDANNWNPDGIPGIGDDVVITGGLFQIFVSGVENVNNLTLQTLSSGFTAVQLTVNSGASLTVDGDVTLSTFAGSFGVQLVVDGTLNLGGSISNSGSVFTPGPTSTVNYNGTGSQTVLSSSSLAYNNLTISGSGTKTSSGTLTVDGTLSILGGTLVANGAINPVQTLVVNGGIFEANEQLTVNADVIITSGTLQVDNGMDVAGNVFVNGGTFDINSQVDLDNDITLSGGLVDTDGQLNILGDLTINNASATLDLDISPIEVGGNFTNTGGGMVLTNPGQLFVYNGTGSQEIAAIAYEQLIIDNNRVNGSTITLRPGTITIDQSFTNNALESDPDISYVTTGNTVNYSSPGITISNAFIYNNLQISENATLGANDVTVAGDLTLSNGTLSLNGSTLNLQGNVTSGGGGLVTSNGTLNLNGTSGPQTIDPTGSVFPNILVDNDVSISGPITISESLELTSTHTFTSNDNHVFIGRNLVNNGTFDLGTSTLTFNGVGVTQSISGSSSISVADLTFDNEQNFLNINSSVNVSGTVTLVQGDATLDADGSGSGTLTLLSTSPSTTARIAAIPSTSSVVGNVRSQRFVDTPIVDRWLHLAFPYSNVEVSDIQAAANGNTFPITGIFTGQSVGSGPSVSDAANLYFYDESRAGDVDQGWTEWPTTFTGSAADVVEELRGYAAWVWNTTDFPGNTRPITIEVSGEINQGTVNLPVTFTDTPAPIADDGWNFVANPYPSAIDWGAPSGWTKTNIQGGIAYVWDGLSDGMGGGTYTALDGSAAGQLIASGQAFWVKAGGASPALVANEAVKASGSVSLLSSEVTEQITVNILGNDQSDQLRIRFSDDAQFGLDIRDGFKLNNVNHLNLAQSVGDSLNFAFSYLPANECEYIIPLNIYTISPGSYELSFTDLETLGFPATVELHDRYDSVVVTLQNFDTYGFTVTGDPVTYGSERFSLVLRHEPVKTNVWIQLEDVCSGQSSTISFVDPQQEATYYLVNQANDILWSWNTGNVEVDFTLSDELLQFGENTLRLIGANRCDSVVVKEQVLVNKVDYVEAETITAEPVCVGSDAVISVNLSGAGRVNLYEAVDAVEPVISNEDGLLQLPGLIGSTTYYVGVENTLGCESERVAVNVEVVDLIEAASVSVEAVCAGSGSSIAVQYSGEGTVNFYETPEATEPIFSSSDGIFNTPILSENTTYYYAIANALNCEGERVEAIVEVVDLIEVSTIEANDICSGNTSQVTATGSTAGGIFNFYDEPGSLEPVYSTSDGVFTTTVLDESRQYYVAIENELGCEGERSEIFVEVIQLPEPIIIQTEEYLKSDYQGNKNWYFNDEFISSGDSVQIEEQGTYTLEITNGDCSSRTSIELLLTSSETDDVNARMAIYPNPASTYLRINFLNEDPVALRVISIDGRVHEERNLQSSQLLKYELNISELKSGIYILKISNEGFSRQIRFIKE